MAKETPLMKQYKEIKSQHKDSILFFRLGDFYEMFFEDAVISSKELGITLTSRNKEKDQEVPLAGVPFHSSASYISKLVAKGYKVAICEQVEDPKEAKGIVKREVVKVITPGTVIDTEYLDEKSNNYLLGIKISDESAALAYVDITTGEFRTTEVEGENLIFKVLNEVHKVAPNEIVISEANYEKYSAELENYTSLSEVVINKIGEPKNCEELLKEYFGVVSLESYGLSHKELVVQVCGDDAKLCFGAAKICGTANRQDILRQQGRVYGAQPDNPEKPGAYTKPKRENKPRDFALGAGQV